MSETKTSISKRPLIFFVPCPDRCNEVGKFAALGDWSVTIFDPTAPLPVVTHWPFAILIAGRPDAEAIVAQIRHRADPLADAPILIADPGPLIPGADRMTQRPLNQSLFEQWRASPNSALPRLIDHFGTAAILALVAGLHSTLRSTVLPLNEADAHHLAGLAGTLGYTDLAVACDAAQYGLGEDDVIRRELRKATYDSAKRLSDVAGYGDG